MTNDHAIFHASPPPTHAFPAQIRTGDARIDTYLETLDRALVGKVTISMQTLLEARDFLMESLAHARDAGGDKDTALRAAIVDFGDTEDVARDQRAARAKLFWSMAWRTGPGFASLMLALTLLGEGLVGQRWPLLAGSFIFQAAFFGGCMGYFFAYLFAKPMPTAQAAAGPDTFTVHYEPINIISCWAMLLVVGLSDAVFAMDLAGLGPFSDWSALGTIFLMIISLKIPLGCASALRFKANVSAERVVLSGLTGQESLQREQIVSLTVPGLFTQITWAGLGPARRLTWRDASGRLRTRNVSCDASLVNGDRLMAWLESAAGQRAVSPPLIQRVG